MKWNEVKKDHAFQDGSVVTQRHQTHTYDCYRMHYSGRTLTASKDHLLKVDISRFCFDAIKDVEQYCVGEIPTKENLHIKFVGYLSQTEKELVTQHITGEIQLAKIEDISEGSTECWLYKNVPVFVHRETIESEPQKIDEHYYWISLDGIYYLYTKYGETDFGFIIDDMYPVGQLPCFCVSTNTGQYSVNGLTNHNSVWVQNVILHAIEHNDEIALALIDPKIVEFTNYKDMKGIVGVANNTEESLEILRIARLIMYKRNKELAELGCKQVSEYVPHKESGKIFVCGREYGKDEQIKVRVDGQEKTMTAEELADLCAQEGQ